MRAYRLCCFFALCLCFNFNAFSAGSTEPKTAELQSGNVKLVFYENTGSFCLYRLSEIGHDNYVPLYDDRALASTNQYSLLVNDKIYKIKKPRGKSAMVVETAPHKLTVTYNLNKILQVKQVFYFITTPNSKDTAPVLCIETSFENTTGSSADVALKAVFDTNLGEKQRIPLYTDSFSILSETYVDLANTDVQYISSANSIAGCVFFMNKDTQNPPSDVFIANWDYLQTMKWAPTIKEGRSFSTKYYNNDSALLLLWPTKRLNLNETYTSKTYIGYYDYLHRAVPLDVMEQHLKTLSKKDKKSYDDILALLQKIEEVKRNPEKYDEKTILELSNAIDSAIKELH